MKRLIVNADDFGFTRDVNSGIIEAYREGILRATTLMANGDAFDDAVRLAAANPDLDVGVHFVLIGGHSLYSGRPLPRGIPELVRSVFAGELDLYQELAAQVERIRKAGLSPLHADTHKHTHLLLPVQRALFAVAEAYGIRWIRKPADLPLNIGEPWTRRIVSKLMRRMTHRFDEGASAAGLRHTDHFAGFGITGAFTARHLVQLFATLPEGITELMTHPGHCTAELERAATRLKGSRLQELQALKATETKAALAAYSIELARYRDL